MELVKRLLNGDKRACARLITQVENNYEGINEKLKKIYPKTGNAYVIGITGPPGSGKSTLTNQLVKSVINKNLKIGVVAVDPTSPFTGGSILGDRVRMNDLNEFSNVFIRSMGARGHLGGLNDSISATIALLDAFGCDYIFVETVGVGQSEVEVMEIVDTTVMVMVPGLGDDIQAIKAGIMEIGDVFAVNKADKKGAKRKKREIEMMLDFSDKDWRPTVDLVSALKGENIKTLKENILNHKDFLYKNDLYHHQRKENIKKEIVNLVKNKVLKDIQSKDKKLDELAKEVINRKNNPYSASEEILDGLKYKAD